MLHEFSLHEFFLYKFSLHEFSRLSKNMHFGLSVSPLSSLVEKDPSLPCHDLSGPPDEAVGGGKALVDRSFP